ncbi:YqzG/YhdC family protein [Tuberibacillus sp. Marseille-P3662]|uniref:YqzG/YhdC family protein n=1 Tax=Tuberibacillus sp. Marseille-P3662 TaxID=1965358 RepID=UPI0020CAF055|nr:YqzG/YhdC family protein [Tuberibacillus sp. Marseille-P3662]
MYKILAALVLLIGINGANNIPQVDAETQQAPAYAKWGKIAVKKAQEKYSNAQVVDYLHIGREKQSNDEAVEKFKLWLKQQNKEFGVYVNVTFNPMSGQFINITFKETGH